MLKNGLLSHKYLQGQENEGELGKGNEQAVDKGKSTNEEQQQAESTDLVSHTAGTCHTLSLLKSHNLSQDMSTSQLTMSPIHHPPLQSIYALFLHMRTCDVVDWASMYHFT